MKLPLYAIQKKVSALLKEDRRFDTDAHGAPEGSPTDLMNEPFCIDIIIEGSSLEAVIHTDDKRTVRIPITVSPEGEVTLGDGEPTPTECSTVYSTLIEQHEATVKAATEATPAGDIVHCRDNGAAIKADKSEAWEQDKPVKFCYMPAGVHTITAGFCGNMTKGRDSSIRLTVEVNPDRDAKVCQASLESIVSEAPKYAPYGCFEHDEKQASVWATRFESGLDPVFNEPAVILEGKPSRGGADAVNGKDWRSWSPSFSTNAEYSKCKCSRCDSTIAACDCEKPAFYFPPSARGSEEKPAQVTGVATVLGTLTNRPAFKAMPPVKAKEASPVVTASGTSEGAKKGWELRDRAHNLSMLAYDAGKEANLSEHKLGLVHREDYESQDYKDKVREVVAHHNKAAELHKVAESIHRDVAKDARYASDHNRFADHHKGQVEHHSEYAKSLVQDYLKSTDATPAPAKLTASAILKAKAAEAAAQVKASEPPSVVAPAKPVLKATLHKVGMVRDVKTILGRVAKAGTTAA